MADRSCWWCERGERYHIYSYSPAGLKDIPHPDSELTPTEYITTAESRIDLCRECAGELVDNSDVSDDGDELVADNGRQCHTCGAGFSLHEGLLCHLDGQMYCMGCVLGWDSEELMTAADQHVMGNVQLAVVRGDDAQCMQCGQEEYPGTFTDVQGNPFCMTCICDNAR